jgi:hypothetical protein
MTELVHTLRVPPWFSVFSVVKTVEEPNSTLHNKRHGGRPPASWLNVCAGHRLPTRCKIPTALTDGGVAGKGCWYYFGMTDLLPPGDPGGGITGVVPVLLGGGLTAIPGSTLGGVIVPFCCDSRSLRFPFAGAIFSGGGVGAFGGAIGTVGLAGGAA